MRPVIQLRTKSRDGPQFSSILIYQSGHERDALVHGVAEIEFRIRFVWIDNGYRVPSVDLVSNARILTGSAYREKLSDFGPHHVEALRGASVLDAAHAADEVE
jgi:hypothetical protein